MRSVFRRMLVFQMLPRKNRQNNIAFIAVAIRRKALSLFRPTQANDDKNLRVALKSLLVRFADEHSSSRICSIFSHCIALCWI